MIDLGECSGCGLCATSCKHGIFALDTDKVIVGNPLEKELRKQFAPT